MIFSLSYLFVYRNSPKFLLWNFGAHFFPSTNVWSNRRWMFSFMFFLLNWLQSNSSVVGSPNINFTTYGNPLFCSLRLEKSAVCLLLVWSFDEYVDRMKRMYYDHFSEKWRRVNVQPKCVWTERSEWITSMEGKFFSGEPANISLQFIITWLLTMTSVHRLKTRQLIPSFLYCTIFSWLASFQKIEKNSWMVEKTVWQWWNHWNCVLHSINAESVTVWVTV